MSTPTGIAPFRAVRELPGGEGRCWLCVDPAGREALCKLLPEGVAPREASLLRSLRHPRVPAVIAEGVDERGRAWLLREWVAGETLDGLLPAGGVDAERLARELFELLGYVHLRGLLHLDVKPSNILRTADGGFVLLDFGLGVRHGAGAAGGTPVFVAPEVVAGRTPDARADLYSLGVVLLLVLVPRLAARGSELFRRSPHAWLQGPDAARLDPVWRTRLDRLLRPEPHERCFDAREVLEDLFGLVGRPSLALLEPDPEHCPPERALSVDEMAGHLVRALDLPQERAEACARQWSVDGAPTPATVFARLRTEVERGVILPEGDRWIWPDRLLGREAREVEPPRDEHELGRLAARGAIEAAERGFRDLAASLGPEAEPALREALARGFLQAGEAARVLPLSVPDPLRWRALLELGRVREARVGLEAAGGAGADAELLRLSASLAFREGDLERAEAEARAAHAGGPGPEAAVVLAHVLATRGRRKEAEDLLRPTLADLDAGARPFLRAAAATNLADLLRGSGRLDEAERWHREALGLYGQLGALRHTALSLSNLGVVLRARGALDEALPAQRRAMALFERAGDERGRAVAMANLGILAADRDHPAEALRRLEEADEALAAIGLEEPRPRIRVEIARARARMGGVSEARVELEQLRAGGGPELDARITQVLDELDAMHGQEAEAQVDGNDRERSPTIPTETFRTFQAINRRLASEQDLDKALQYLLDTAVTVSGARLGSLLLAGDDGVRIELRSGDLAGERLAFSRSLVNRALQEQRMLGGDEALADRDLLGMPSVRRLEQRSVLCVPFRCASQRRGALYLEHPGRAAVFGPRERELGEVLADQAAIAVDRMFRERALAADLERKSRDLEIARREIGAASVERPLLGDSPVMEKLRRDIDRLADSDLPILIHGETGTGKELVARALHARSRRGRGPFVSENCSAIPAELAESLLFGHVRGAFTGADEDRPGLLELASGGTLFLDEVGDLPLELQAKLLRALQEGQARPVGGSRTVPLDIRVLAATHKDLAREVGEGRFRQDLYYRIAAADIEVPPLRDRGSDRLLLAERFLERLAAAEGCRARLSDRARGELMGHGFPGNVRELEHLIAKAFLLRDGEVVEGFGLSPGGSGRVPEGTWPVLSLAEAEARTIRAALAACDGDKTKAARLLGISRTTLYEKLKKLAD